MVLAGSCSHQLLGKLQAATNVLPLYFGTNALAAKMYVKMGTTTSCSDARFTSFVPEDYN